MGCLRLICLACLLFGLSSFAQPALASTHVYQERPQQLTYRSQQSLRDRQDRSWQAVLFKRFEAETLAGVYLRIVGFPGLVAVDQAKPLKIDTGTALSWQAASSRDRTLQQLPPNVGQYDVQSAIAELNGNIPLQLTVPLQGGGVAELVAAPFVVREWRSLAQTSLESLQPERYR
ncbi:MAG: DUF3122 domain-containing protein [Leptolyngbyaceae cyanobacterium SM1_1_3]|nr:DUF3122 domain-containing protein [Leptolyngbyaceae cyanobacterium SM1_1_3]NJN02299.1 DUF3122 domain-containing protein [Leptolyngbyaceae cyanobacterium RM1_1_2]NJO11491.1 DUF3122 domain-containing protein [Leptolyngbyaceae cyanobacterium SL_1_1]